MKFVITATTYIFPLPEVSSFLLLLHGHLKKKSNLLYPYTLTQLCTTTADAGVPLFYNI
jgi:hypothetical protein